MGFSDTLCYTCRPQETYKFLISIRKGAGLETVSLFDDT